MLVNTSGTRDCDVNGICVSNLLVHQLNHMKLIPLGTVPNAVMVVEFRAPTCSQELVASIVKSLAITTNLLCDVSYFQIDRLVTSTTMATESETGTSCAPTASQKQR
jgi:hypothetical protein